MDADSRLEMSEILLSRTATSSGVHEREIAAVRALAAMKDPAVVAKLLAEARRIGSSPAEACLARLRPGVAEDRQRDLLTRASGIAFSGSLSESPDRITREGAFDPRSEAKRAREQRELARDVQRWREQRGLEPLQVAEIARDVPDMAI